MTDQAHQPARKISRREFLRTSGLTLAGATLACLGLGYALTRPPEIDEYQFEFHEETHMNQKILIAYATRAGSTAEIAAELGRSLQAQGYAADVIPVKEKPALTDYQAVILGSAIRMGSWLPEAVQYIKDNQAQLESLPTALFTVHMLNTGDDRESRANRLAYLDPVRPILPGAEEIYFEGAMDFSKLSFLDRTIAKMVGSEEADHRDWEQIRGWMPETIAQELTHG